MDKVIFQSQSQKFNTYLRNLSIIFLILSSMCLFSFIGFALFATILVVLTLVSFGLLFLNENFLSLWQNIDKLSDFSSLMYSYCKYFAIAGIVLSIVTIILTCKNRYYHKNNSAFIFAIVSLVLQIVILVFAF